MAYYGSATPLGANETWTSGVGITDRADRITGVVKTDQPGVLWIEQSGDGTNWDVSTGFNIVADTAQKFSEEILLPYLRVRYQNGGAAQTYFRFHSRHSSAGDS